MTSEVIVHASPVHISAESELGLDKAGNAVSLLGKGAGPSTELDVSEPLVNGSVAKVVAERLLPGSFARRLLLELALVTNELPDGEPVRLTGNGMVGVVERP